MRRAAAALLLAICLPLPVLATQSAINEHVNNAKQTGSADFRFLFMDIYQVTLYAPQSGWSFSEPFALQIRYLRNLPGDKIADRSAKEIRQQGFNDEVTLADWHEQMTQIIPDVQENTVLTGIYKPNDETVFYQDGKQIGRVQDPEFGKWFFGIWLSENTSEPQVRAQLLGR